MGDQKNKKTKKLIGIFLSMIVLAAFLFVIPASEGEGGLNQQALNTIGVFVTFVLLMVFDVVPMIISGAVCCVILVQIGRASCRERV